MSDDQFTKLFKYMQQEFGNIRKELGDLRSETKNNFDRVYGVLDTLVKDQETSEQERLFANHQIDHHKGWIVQLAKNTKTKLAPEP